jgi:Putative Flp pilus-assembly TadE/G-like
LSSTTDRAPERGQIIVLFAGALFTICVIAALVFDVGQSLLDRRSEQNAADAAALAGARYVIGAGYSFHGGCSTSPGPTMPVVQAACSIASQNGYIDGQGGETVRVDFPPIAPSAFSGLPGHVEVTIHDARGSFFAGLLGVGQMRTGSSGVATNDSDIALPYSLLALDPTDCGANFINGSPGTIVTTDGTVHIDSSCPGSALLLSGNGVLNAPECDVVGGIQRSGGAGNNCAAAPAGILASGDPLKNLAPPAEPTSPRAVQPLDSPAGPIPAGCPGGTTPATDAAPLSCDFSTGQTKNKHYRIFPGAYPGGISVSNAVVLMDPGLYWIGGGGVSVKSTGGVDGVLVSKATGDNSYTATPSGGVLIYNTQDPNPLGCNGVTTTGCYAGITMNGGPGATGETLSLLPIQSGLYENMVIFVDRTYGFGGVDDIVLNGGNANLNISGTMYAPTGVVKLNGSDTDSIASQIICYSFQVNGSGSAFTISYHPDDLFHVKGVGLVE